MIKLDVTVVGGGVIGLAIACALRREGLRVGVVEKGRCGKEASWASAGVLAPHAGPGLRTPYFEFLRKALTLYPDFVKEVEDETGVDTEFRRSEMLYLATDAEEQEALKDRHRWQVESGVLAEWLLPEEIRKLEPMAAPCALAGIYFPEDCQIDNVKLVEALRCLAEKTGVEIFEEMSEVRFRIENDAVRGVLSKQETFESPVAVNAAGAWADFDDGLPFRIPVKPSRGQILVFHGEKNLLRHMLHIPGTYAVSRSDGRIFVGSTVESAGFDRSVTAKGLNKLVSGLLAINPEFSSLRFLEARVGFRPRSKDNQPILGKSPVKGLFLATGHFRNGVLLAPVTGKLVAEMILGKELSLDCAPFGISRFLNAPRKSSRRKNPDL